MAVNKLLLKFTYRSKTYYKGQFIYAHLLQYPLKNYG